MSSLILPPTDIVPVKALKPSRRGFMQCLAGAFTGAVAAPMILPFSSLDDINSLQNRMMVAFTQHGGSYVTESGINAVTFINPELMRKWRAWHHSLDYQFVRRAEVKHFRSVEDKRNIMRDTLTNIEHQDKWFPNWVPHRLKVIENRQAYLAQVRANSQA